LNIVHVAGTKGKGSTCAYVDSILSQYRKSHDIPHKVGLFTSPHLIAVRERIRINSSPISADLFTKYFFEVWDRLEASPSDSAPPFEKPVYFRYLTLMSYHVFLQERVDTAIYEVGMGGEYDSTNIVERPAVTGISTLGIDHTFNLGETVDKIAWHKAGIQKKGVPSFTVPQLPAAMEVVKRRAEERGVEAFTVVDIDQRLESVKIRPDAAFQKGNASLAIALTETVLKKLDPKFETNPDSLPPEFVAGLEQVVWRGRCEKKVEEYVTWYLDGAHTADSIVVAAKWFGSEVAHT
jgi:folylpolyglutamate synthase/dihydrofolate synthase